MSENGFQLHPDLAADTALVCDLPLCQVLLMDDANWPWLILVPRHNGLRELMDLAREDRIALSDEIDLVSRLLQTRYEPDKLNVAALGNQVEQLHVHVIARSRNDPAWPSPVWGRFPPLPYTTDSRLTLAQELATALAVLMSDQTAS